MKFRAALKAFGAKGLMGRVGACGDNAAMESFFALVQKNVLDRKPWANRRELSAMITRWIELLITARDVSEHWVS